MPERARQIMEAALELAEEGGFEAVRLRDVAARAGVALGTLYARFRSKEDILIAVLDREAVKLEELVARYPIEGDTPAARVEAYFALVTQAMFARPNFSRAVLHAVSVGGPETSGTIMRYQARLNALIVRSLRGPDGHGPLTDEQEQRFASLLQQLWYAALVGWANGVRAEEEIMEQMRVSIPVLLAGFQAIGRG